MRTLERKREVPQLHVIVVVAHLSAREEGGLVDKLISPRGLGRDATEILS